MAGTLRTIGVVGAGQMGAGIAQVAATAGLQVVLRDVKDEFVQRGLAGIRDSLARFEKKGTLSAEQAAAALGRVRGTTALEELAEADLVIEAIVEDVDLKARLFQDLDRLTRPEVVLASNTSSIPITRLGAATRRPGRVVGMHFFNPVPLMPLVEVVRGHDTTDETAALVSDLARRFGKTAVEARDFPGFVSNRVLMPMLNEAMFAVHEGVAGVEAVDAVMRLGMNHPMGPLELADFIGLDTCLAILRVLHDGFGDPKYRACPLLVQKVTAGHLGRKSGRGFYVWEGGKKARPA